MSFRNALPVSSIPELGLANFQHDLKHVRESMSVLIHRRDGMHLAESSEQLW
jgi:hypothetical protein